VGQGHVDWCEHAVLEEDVDWVVSPIPGKGRGLVVKTLIPPWTRIIVDGRRDKMLLATVHPNKPIDSERAWLINHACDMNAIRIMDPHFQLKILVFLILYL